MVQVNDHETPHDDAMETVNFPPTHDYENTTQDFPPQQSVNEGFVPQFPTQQSSAVPQFPPQQSSANAGFVPQFPLNMGPTMPPRNNPMINAQIVVPQPWSSSIFACMDNPENAIVTACFPCVTFGQIAEIVDGGTKSCGTSGIWYTLIALCIGMPCLMSHGYRSRMRSRFGLMESPAPDCIVHCFCEWCALCQEYRELQARGIDPSIGWIGNVAKQQQKLGMTPPMQQRMM